MSILFTHFFSKINKISPLETDFTEVLGSIALTPKTLYFYGNLPKNVVKSSKNPQQNNIFDAPSRPKTVAIVGSRHSTKYGEEVAYKLAYELARHDVIIVSGLAFGIDGIAHRGCLDAGGVTVAVLGTAIDHIYPRAHLPLAQEILEKNGAVLSEYAPRSLEDAPLAPGEFGFDGQTWLSYDNPSALPPFKKRRIDQKLSFLQRNRLISGLSDVVIVVEAAERSGSLNTAAHALSQGKEVFAVPGNITSPFSKGCNKLIKQGAAPLTDPEDVLRLLFPENYLKKPKSTRPVSGGSASQNPAECLNLKGSTPEETAILGALNSGLRSGDDIMKSASLTPEVFNQSITMLELSGLVRPLGLNNWMLV